MHKLNTYDKEMDATTDWYPDEQRDENNWTDYISLHELD